MQIKERSAETPRGSLFRRFLGGPSDDLERPLGDPSMAGLDLTTGPEEWQQATALRIERLEAGLRLLAETMRRAFVRVSDDVQGLRGDLERLPDLDVERSVAQALEPLSRSVETLSDAVARVPHILAAATQHVDDRLAGLRDERFWTDGAEAATWPMPRIVSPDLPPPGTMGPHPFELEPIEQGFDAIGRPRSAEDAGEIWAEPG